MKFQHAKIRISKRMTWIEKVRVLIKQQVQFLNSLFVKCRLKSIKYHVTA